MQSLFDLNGKVVVITGGAGVLGSELARGFAKAGAKVAVLDRNPADELVAEIKEAKGDAITISCDALDRESLVQARDEILAQFGTIDVLVNGVGGNSPSATTSPSMSFFDLSEKDLDHVVRLNFMGTLLPSQVFGEVFADKKEGVILNISSMTAIRPLTNVVGYGGAKAAVSNFTQWLAVHLNKHYSANIRVNAMAPGFFLTKQNRFLLTDEETGDLTARGRTIIEHTPMGRFGDPSDLVGTAIWLVSDASRFVTGIVVPVDGGFSAFAGV
jgi:NAD(P)-dependent dehydrogenase (short-subunit alcohol dehydrogenase family)